MNWREQHIKKQVHIYILGFPNSPTIMDGLLVQNGLNFAG